MPGNPFINPDLYKTDFVYDGKRNEDVVLPVPKATPTEVNQPITYVEPKDGDAGWDGNIETTERVYQPKPESKPLKVRSADGLLQNAFGSTYNISPEEEQRRLRRAQSIKDIHGLTRALGAFANSMYVGKGAASATLPEAKLPSHMDFVNRVETARQQALAREYQQKDYELKQQAAQQTAEYNEARKKMLEAQAKSYEALAEQRGNATELAEVKALVEQGKLELAKERLEALKQKWANDATYKQASLGVQRQRANVAQQNADRLDRSSDGSVVTTEVNDPIRGVSKTTRTTAPVTPRETPRQQGGSNTARQSNSSQAKKETKSASSTTAKQKKTAEQRRAEAKSKGF